MHTLPVDQEIEVILSGVGFELLEGDYFFRHNERGIGDLVEVGRRKRIRG